MRAPPPTQLCFRGGSFSLDHLPRFLRAVIPHHLAPCLVTLTLQLLLLFSSFLPIFPLPQFAQERWIQHVSWLMESVAQSHGFFQAKGGCGDDPAQSAHFVEETEV